MTCYFHFHLTGQGKAHTRADTEGEGTPTYHASGRRGRTEEFVKSLVTTTHPTVNPGATGDF